MKRQGLQLKEQTSRRGELYSNTPLHHGADLLATLSSDEKVLDMCLDHYGQRLAACTSNGMIRVWDLDCSTGQWVCSAGAGSEWQAGASIHQLCWAHPNFGQILASAGSDHSVIVWEECEEETEQGTDLPSTNRKHWVSKVHINDATALVTCISFAPPHLGVKIAAGSQDGLVRIYEATDIVNLQYWPLNGCLDIEATITTQSKSTSTSSSSSILGTEPSVGVTCLAWSTQRLQEPPTVAIGTSNGTIALYRYSDTARQWLLLRQFPGCVRGGVVKIAWAPYTGRNFHWIASTGHDRTLQMHRLATSSSKPYDLISSQTLQEGDAIWRCSWNATGTVLASTSLGGMIRMWKVDFWNHWKCVAQIHPHEATSSDTPEMEEDMTKHTTTTILDQVMAIN